MTETPDELTPEIAAGFADARKRRAAIEAEPKSDLSSFLPGNVRKLAKMGDASRATEHEYLKKDDQGAVFISKNSLNKLKDKEAMARHGNDPNVRLDEWGFPGGWRQRQFILKHDFGKTLQTCLRELRNRKWIYLYGNIGLGKTALAVRAVWELLKDRPTSKATFISANNYIREAVRRESAIQAALRRGGNPDPDTGGQPLRNLVVLDDLDKFNWRNDFNIYCLLSLIEKLQNPNPQLKRKGSAWVLITAQFSIDELMRRHGQKEDVAPLCDRLRQMCYVLPRFEGASKR